MNSDYLHSYIIPSISFILGLILTEFLLSVFSIDSDSDFNQESGIIMFLISLCWYMGNKIEGKYEKLSRWLFYTNKGVSVSLFLFGILISINTNIYSNLPFSKTIFSYVDFILLAAGLIWFIFLAQKNS